MQHQLLASCLAACVLLSLSACDRRQTQPPDESRAATTDVRPAGTAGDASQPADSANPDTRCDGLQGQQQRDCMEQVEATREATDLRQ